MQFNMTPFTYMNVYESRQYQYDYFQEVKMNSEVIKEVKIMECCRSGQDQHDRFERCQFARFERGQGQYEYFKYGQNQYELL